MTQVRSAAHGVKLGQESSAGSKLRSAASLVDGSILSEQLAHLHFLS